MRASWFLVGPLSLVAACMSASEAGISFFAGSDRGSSGQIAFRFNDGSGWQDATARVPTRAVEAPYDYSLRRIGSLKVEAILMRSGAPLARVTSQFPTQPDRRYEVFTVLGDRDPTLGCMGCSEAVSAPIAGSSDRLWLYHGFNGISRPIEF